MCIFPKNFTRAPAGPQPGVGNVGMISGKPGLNVGRTDPLRHFYRLFRDGAYVLDWILFFTLKTQSGISMRYLLMKPSIIKEVAADDCTVLALASHIPLGGSLGDNASRLHLALAMYCSSVCRGDGRC